MSNAVRIATTHRTTRRLFRRVVLAGLLACLVLSVRAQDVPGKFNYQGQLKAGDGSAVAAGSFELTFRIYDAPIGGNYLWAVRKSVLVDAAGLFNVELEDPATYTAISDGAANPQHERLVDALTAGTATKYLEIQVGSSNPIRPRQGLLSVPYAMLAGDVKNTSGDLRVDGTLRVTDDLNVTGTASAAAFSGIGIVPIGCIIAWHHSMSGADTLAQVKSAGFALCNGQTASQQGISGAVITAATPDLNGDKRFLRGGSTSGTLQADSIKSHHHSYTDYYHDDTASESTRYSAGAGDDGGGNGSSGRTTGSTGSTETRPINMSVVWIMRVK